MVLCRLMAVVVAVLLTAQVAAAASCAAVGKTAVDKKIADAMCKGIGPATNDQVHRIIVDDVIMRVHMTFPFYQRLYRSRTVGNKVARALVTGFREASGKPIVTVWFFADGHRLIEAGDSLWGGIKISYLDD